MKNFTKRLIKNRIYIQATFLIIAVIVTINHVLIQSGKGLQWLSNSYLHYVCPICGITTIQQLIFSGTLIKDKLLNPVTLIVTISLVIAVIGGPVFCGWMCPFGAYQDLLAKLGKRLFKENYNTSVKGKTHNTLKWLRYVVLIVVIYMTSRSYISLLEKINPYHSLLNFFQNKFTLSGFIVLSAISLISLIIQRPWCKYLCPYGALLGLSNKIKLLTIKNEKKTCVNCRKCDNKCPMNIKISDLDEIRDIQCISCMECSLGRFCTNDGFNLSEIDKGKIKHDKKVVQLIILTCITIILGIWTFFSIKDLKKESTFSPENNRPDGFHHKRKRYQHEQQVIMNNIDMKNKKYKDGVFTGEAVGYSPNLTVSVTVKNNEIKSIEIISHNETPGFYEKAFETIPTKIIENQSTNIDTVSGATMSSIGIINAVNDALAKAEIN
ncbi:polyferredoxin [Fervidicella metallireducens AeB]|uniref:Polyferredoxin n=1 Tax=Fervidicella metallireducens AeB TaxID=1403537 RepID=A0A017RUE8_9CLOT|nr:FMN-binding protein [Fervidicella metallireducens]EYE88236.1 polyferredoxin [Fervidicella metallireducens AeB]